jgi:hypothetical protein
MGKSKKKKTKKKLTVSLFDWGEELEELVSIAKREDWCTYFSAAIAPVITLAGTHILYVNRAIVLLMVIRTSMSYACCATGTIFIDGECGSCDEEC